MIKEGIIYSVNQFEWASPMVFHHKNHDPKNIPKILESTLTSDGLTKQP